MIGRRWTVRLVLREPPRWLRVWRRRRYPDGRWSLASSQPWWCHWFAVLVPYRLRWAHRWYAGMLGYFWLPCPLCGRPFGGHEWRSVAGREDSVPDPTGGPGRSVGICPPCTRARRGVESTVS